MAAAANFSSDTAFTACEVQWDTDKSMITSIVLAAAINVIIVIVFFVLRRVPFLRLFFEPQPLVRPKFVPKEQAIWDARDHPPSPTIGWVVGVLTYPYDTLFRLYGLDVVMYIRTLRTFLYLACFYAVYGIVVLLPVNATGDNHNLPEDSPSFTCGMNILTMANISRSTQLFRFYCHAIGCILTTGVTLFALVLDYRFFAHYVYKSNGCIIPANFSCMIKQIPRNISDDLLADSVNYLFDNVKRITRVPIAPKIEKEQQHYVSIALRKEAAEAAFHKSKKHKRPKTRAIVEKSKIPHQLAPVCVHLDKVDAIDYYTGHTQRMEEKIEKMQSEADKLGMTSTVFVTFNTARAALSAAFVSISATPSRWTIHRAPHPKDIAWGNLGMSWKQRFVRRTIILMFCFALVIMWGIPIALAATLFTLSNLSSISWLSWIATIINGMGPAVAGFITGMLPAIIVIIAYAILEPLLLFMASKCGYAAITHANATALHWYYTFVIVNVFLVSAVATTFLGFIDQITQIASSPLDVVKILAKALPAQSSYFINYIIAGSWAVTLELLRPVALVLWILKYYKLAGTPREKEIVSLQSEYDYVYHYGWFTLIWAITLTFTPLAPAILPFAVFYFLTAATTSSYLLMCVPKTQDPFAYLEANHAVT
eukprot:TRINITY_DN3919_c0_g2_i2.p1 TRINITY_DN3919_c0_g2~~TRINITY_DN3919_c0_g2_i2.p1  ORF type:complete len:653 (-),score=129.68 TRINITY_DN3919_c0_g2_i2:1193-3151(-)